MITCHPALRGPWAIREDALREMARITRAAPSAGLIPGQSQPQPPDYPDRSKAGPGYDVVNGVAVLPIRGPIYRHAGFVDDYLAFLFGGISIDRIADALRAALADDSARSILLSFDTPGGQVTGLDHLAAMIREAGSVKPLAAFAEGMCCSAGYYLASATGEVTASPTALVGSIGTIAVFLDDSGMLEQMGLKEIPIVSSQSPKKLMDPATPEGFAEWQGVVDACAAVFVADVAKYRGVTVEAVLDGFGQGSVFVGAAARKAGLVDRIGTVDDAIRKLSGRNRARLAVASPAARVTAGSQVLPAPIRARLRLAGPGRAS